MAQIRFIVGVSRVVSFIDMMRIVVAVSCVLLAVNVQALQSSRCLVYNRRRLLRITATTSAADQSDQSEPKKKVIRQQIGVFNQDRPPVSKASFSSGAGVKSIFQPEPDGLFTQLKKLIVDLLAKLKAYIIQFVQDAKIRVLQWIGKDDEEDEKEGGDNPNMVLHRGQDVINGRDSGSDDSESGASVSERVHATGRKSHDDEMKELQRRANQEYALRKLHEIEVLEQENAGSKEVRETRRKAKQNYAQRKLQEIEQMEREAERKVRSSGGAVRDVDEGLREGESGDYSSSSSSRSGSGKSGSNDSSSSSSSAEVSVPVPVPVRPLPPAYKPSDLINFASYYAPSTGTAVSTSIKTSIKPQPQLQPHQTGEDDLAQKEGGSDMGEGSALVPAVPALAAADAVDSDRSQSALAAAQSSASGGSGGSDEMDIDADDADSP